MCNGSKWTLGKTRVLHSLLDHSSHDLTELMNWVENKNNGDKFWQSSSQSYLLERVPWLRGSTYPNFRTRIYLSQGWKHYRLLIWILLNSQITAHTQRIHGLQFGFPWNSVFKEIWALSFHFIVTMRSYKPVPWKPRILTNYTSYHSYLFSL